VEAGVSDATPHPHADRAIIPQRKVEDYLLNAAHPNGASKAMFFIRFGFTRPNWTVLAKALHLHIRSHPVARSRRIRFGEVYEVIGPLSTPDGRNPRILTAWMVLHGSDAPHFVTAFPD
jgi:hypothetical protein